MRIRPRTWAPLYLLLATAGACGAFSSAGFRLNVSRSLPRGIYRLTNEPVELGVLVAVCLPHEVARIGRQRGYLARGSCDDGTSPVIKQVAAVGGFAVEVSLDGVTAGGVALVGSSVQAQDRWGRGLPPIESRSYRLRPGELWLHAPSLSSWDSRYFGPVDEDLVLGAVRRVLAID